jgi:hypothetical protein
MSLLDRLAGRFGRFAVPHIGLALVFGQAIVYVGYLAAGARGGQFLNRFGLDLAAVGQGEFWRLFSFIMVPPTTNPFFLLFGLLFLWFTAGALESRWGAFRFNVFLLVGWLATLVAALIGHFAFAAGAVQGALFLTSIFLAFAWLWPDHKILLFFIIPVAVKWLALLFWIGLGIGLAGGDMATRLMILASIANFAVFCGSDVWRWINRGKRQIAQAVTAATSEAEPFHRCAACGVTELKDPQARFRMCTECVPAQEYCMVCLPGHIHKVDKQA